MESTREEQVDTETVQGYLCKNYYFKRE